MTCSASRCSLRYGRLALMLALALSGACAEDDPFKRDLSGVDDDDDQADDDQADDDQADDDQADDDQGDDDVEEPKADAGRRDSGTPARDAGKMDGSVPSIPSDAGVGNGDAGRVADASRDASLEAGIDGGSSDGGKSDGSADAASGDASTSTGELCELKPYQVGIMGDSYIHLSGDFTRILEENARKAGALGAREEYVDRAMSAAAMGSYLINVVPPIPTQLPQVLEDSRRRGPEGVKLIIMTGGGNDVLINNMQCRRLQQPTEECKDVVANSLMIMKKLFGDMKAAGIKEVIYFWYPDLGVQVGKVINDYAIPLAKEACESNADVRCHFVDTRDAFRGHPEYIEGDDIHPTEAGSKVIADLVWDVMVENCLASK